MSTRRIIPHAPAADFANEVLPIGEILVNETTKMLHFGDGSTLGGVPIVSGLPVTLDASLFGIKGDGTLNSMLSFRLWAAAAAAISAAGGRPVLKASGNYRIVADTTFGNVFGERKSISFSGIHNAYLDMAGATWQFDSGDLNTGYATALTITDSDNVSGDLGRVDWRRRPFAQGVVLSKTSPKFRVTLDSGFTPSFNQVQRVEVYDRDRRNLYRIMSKNFSGGGDVAGWPITYPSPGVAEIDFTGDTAAINYLATLAVGDLLVLTYRVYGGNGFDFRNCRNLNVKGRVTSAGGQAWRSLECEDQTVDVTIGAKAGDLIAVPADGLMCLSSRGFLDIKGSVRNTGDDALNLGVDSYSVTSVIAPRSFQISIDFPYIVPRVGDRLFAVGNTDLRTALGKIVSFNFPTVTMDTDLPGGFAVSPAYQVENVSATPVTTFIDTFVAEKVRGHVRMQVPNVSGKIRATDVTDGVNLQYLPSFYGEGALPNSCTIQAELLRCANIASQAGAFGVFAYKLDGGGYGATGSIVKPVIDVIVRETKNSALFMAGVQYAAVSVVSADCCQTPDTAQYGLAEYRVALTNCDNINFISLTNLDATFAYVGSSGTTSNFRYGGMFNYGS